MQTSLQDRAVQEGGGFPGAERQRGEELSTAHASLKLIKPGEGGTQRDQFADVHIAIEGHCLPTSQAGGRGPPHWVRSHRERASTDRAAGYLLSLEKS